jgi:hypothetical protein
MGKDKSEAKVLPQPADVDPDWAEKIARVRQAREARERAEGEKGTKRSGFYVQRFMCRSD